MRTVVSRRQRARREGERERERERERSESEPLTAMRGREGGREGHNKATAPFRITNTKGRRSDTFTQEGPVRMAIKSPEMRYPVVGIMSRRVGNVQVKDVHLSVKFPCFSRNVSAS